MNARRIYWFRESDHRLEYLELELVQPIDSAGCRSLGDRTGRQLPKVRRQRMGKVRAL